MKSNKNKKLKDVSLIPSTIRRRVSPEDLEEAFQDSLDDAIESAYDSKSVFWRVRNSKRWWVFSKWVIDDMITLLEQEFFSDDNRVYFDDGDFYYEKIRKPLIAYYKDRLEEAFYEILKNKNLMEEKKISMKKKSKYDPKKVVHKDDEHIVIDKDLDWKDEVEYDDDDVSYEDDEWMVIDLKEEDLTRIVKKVIKESDLDYWKDYAERKKETESQDNETKHILQILDDETFVDDDENVYAPWIRTRFNVEALVGRTHILLAEAFVHYCMKKFKIKSVEAIKIWRKYVKESIFSKLGYDMSNYPNVNENTKDKIFKEEDLTRIVKKVLKEDTPPTEEEKIVIQNTRNKINTAMKELSYFFQDLGNASVKTRNPKNRDTNALYPNKNNVHYLADKILERYGDENMSATNANDITHSGLSNYFNTNIPHYLKLAKSYGKLRLRNKNITKEGWLGDFIKNIKEVGYEYVPFNETKAKCCTPKDKNKFNNIVDNFIKDIRDARAVLKKVNES